MCAGTLIALLCVVTRCVRPSAGTPIALLCVVTRCVRPSWLLLSLKCERIGDQATCPTGAASLRLGQTPSAHPRGNPLLALTAGSLVRPPEGWPLTSRVPRAGGPGACPSPGAQWVSGAGRRMRDSETMCCALNSPGPQGHMRPPTLTTELWPTITNGELTSLRHLGGLREGRPWSHPPRTVTCMRIRMREKRPHPRRVPWRVTAREAIAPQHSTLPPLTLGHPNSLPPQRPLCYLLTPMRRGPVSEAILRPVGARGGVYLGVQLDDAGRPMAV